MNQARVANNLGDADVTQAELGVTADPGMKFRTVQNLQIWIKYEGGW
jgi:hypothetical protein